MASMSASSCEWQARCSCSSNTAKLLESFLIRSSFDFIVMAESIIKQSFGVLPSRGMCSLCNIPPEGGTPCLNRGDSPTTHDGACGCELIYHARLRRCACRQARKPRNEPARRVCRYAPQDCGC